jgi:hypothetical protein
MNMRHVRLTFNQNAVVDPQYAAVEYGRVDVVGLTPEEREDYDTLEKEFGEATKPEFSKAADLADPVKKERIHRQRRYAELDKKLTEPRMIWMPTDEESMPSSVILIMRQGVLPVYIENMPEEMIKKLMSPQIIVENPQVYMGPQTQAASSPQPQQAAVQQPQTAPPSSPIEQVKAVISRLVTPTVSKKPWISMVSVELVNPAEGVWEKEETKPNRVYVTPLDFLGDDWRPINVALKGAFGDTKALWFGKFKEQSHWELVFE